MTRSNHRNDPFNKPAIREGLIEWGQKLKYPYFLTLNFNMEISVDAARRRIGKFLARMDRLYLGPHWWKKRTERTDLVGFFEHPTSNIHVHSYIKLPLGLEVNGVEWNEQRILRTWKACVPPGSIDLQPIDETPEHLASYMTKGFRQPEFSDLMILAREFWPDLEEAKKPVKRIKR